MHKNCLFMMAASGRLQKDSMQASYTRSEYLCRPGRANQYARHLLKQNRPTFQLKGKVVGQMPTFVIAT